MSADLHIIGGPSVYIVRAASDAGRAWMYDNINVNDETVTFANSVVVEHRYINDIMQGATHDGMKLERYA